MTNQVLPVNKPVSTSLYVHIPWCVKKCPYCDFNSHESKTQPDENRYIDTLLYDLDIDVEISGQREIQSIFFGGGTPSLFSPEAIERIINGAEKRLTFGPGIEITMEANPGTFEQNNFSDFRSAGINRLSIGIQSFNDQQLQLIGRIHDAKQALSAVSTAKKAGFENINIDLMFGLPEQTLDQAINDIQLVCDLDVEHISHYQLTIEPNTFFHKHTPALPGAELLWDIQQCCHQKLNENNFLQYEVSAFSSNNKQCQHNLNYWRFGDYIGIGAGAHGKLTTNNSITRRWKHRQPEAYMTNASGNLLSGKSEIEHNEIVFEFLLNALRLKDGCEFSIFENNTGLDKSVLIQACLKVAPELIIIDDLGVRTSNRGFDFLNDVLQNFI